MSASYAHTTKVPVERSQAEIARLLERFDADGVMTATERVSNGKQCTVAFRKGGIPVKFTFLTDPEDPREERRLWRCACLFIKSKLVLIEEEVSTFEAEFLAWIALPDGGVAGDRLLPQIQEAVEGNQLPKLLPGN